MAMPKSPFPIMNEKQDQAEDAADARRKRLNKGKLPGLEKLPMAAMKKGKK